MPALNSSQSHRFNMQCYTYGTPFSVCIDTGADVSLLTEVAYLKLKELYNIPFVSESHTFNAAATNSSLHIIGTVILPMSFHKSDFTFNVTFHIVTNFALKCDALLGFQDLAENDISLFPKQKAVSYQGIAYYANSDPQSVFDQMTRSVHFEQSPSQLTSKPPSVVISPPVNTVDSKRSVSTTDLYAATVIGDQYIGPTCSHRVTVRLLKAPIGSCVISHPDTVRVHRLALEGTLSSVRAEHVTDALVTNMTGSAITLKDGLHLGSFSAVDESSFQEALPLIAAVSQQPAPSSSPADLATQLSSYVKVVDYPDGRNRLTDLLSTHRQALALPGEPLGVTDRVQHQIDLQPGTRPIYVPSYRLPRSQRQVADNLVRDMLEEGIIQESHSPWNSPLFLVPKKDGTYRAVVDFRRVNSVTIPDHYPLPVLSDILQSIGKDNTVFSTLDLKSGFWQIPLEENSRQVTAFSTPKGHYEWLRCPMGLRNSPLTCQRLVDSLFQGLIGDGLFVYLDDLILVSQNLDSHFAKLSLVLQKFTEAGLKLNLTKCKFLRASIEFLGHVVDKDGIHTTSEKIKAVQHFPSPKSTDNVNHFLALQVTTVPLSVILPLLRLHLRVFSRRTFPSNGIPLTNKVLTNLNQP